VPHPRIKEFQRRFTEYLTTSKSELLALVTKEKALNDPLTADLKAAATAFKQGWA
jgi:F0F1-type ATP synthase alpha subunit